jgi:DNA topoisomerase-2
MYEKLTHREHVLRRPDTYIGTLEYDETLGMSQGLYKIIDEIIVNAFDEYVRNPKSNEIRLETDGTRVRVMNSACIPSVEDAQLIFGHLLTSSNYDDSKDRFTGGRNGYGAKLTNIYSKIFTVTSSVSSRGEEYEITWRDNMSLMDPPKIRKYSKKSDWLCIEFVPDSVRLGSFSTDTLKRRMIEIGLWGPKVYFNGENISQTFKDYVGEFDASHKQKNWEIYLRKGSEGDVSFVNGVATRKGGTHVEHVLSVISKALGFKVKNHITLFIKVSINKPEFSTQTKDECTSRITDPVEFKPAFIRTVKALGIQNEVDSKKLKKSDGSKRNKITGIPKLDDANWAGTPKSERCTLIITEGDSAKALAVAGLSIVGRDMYGVFPLKGKPKNVRDASVSKLESNNEFSNLKKILGLKQGEVYTNTKKLRYGRLMIMTDADLDGSHIKGLVLNMFEFFWPSLLDIGFVSALVTPVIKADSDWFFTEDDFRTSHKTYKKIKYYKGLGTSTSLEAKEYFKKIESLTVTFQPDSKTKESMNLAFAKNMSPSRKIWLKEYMGLVNKPSIAYGKVQTVHISDFIHKDQVKFSEEDIKRSIPHIADGLKPCQRKVIFACLKKNLEKDSTVAQLSGYIGEVSAYHHGEASLHGTIIGLAQTFTGSNNVNLLVPSGQFGSRLEGGKDHASARYISTRLEPHTKRIFESLDDPLLSWLTDDGKTIEPEFFVPIIPMILVNGADGIATGYSTHIPPCDPNVLVKSMIKLLDKKPLNQDEIVPWFKGFTGKVTRKSPQTWIFHGTYENGCVTELPPGMWIQDYKEFLDRLVESGKIQGYSNHSTESNPRFTIQCDDESILGLSKTVHTSNMFLITRTGIKKFETYEEILLEYMEIRIEFYRKRKAHMLKKYQDKLSHLEMRMRFIECVISGKIEVFRKTKYDIIQSMNRYGFTDETLLNIKTYQYTYEEIERLVNEIQNTRLIHDTLKKTTCINLWKTDLRVLQECMF